MLDSARCMLPEWLVPTKHFHHGPRAVFWEWDVYILVAAILCGCDDFYHQAHHHNTSFISFTTSIPFPAQVAAISPR